MELKMPKVSADLEKTQGISFCDNGQPRAKTKLPEGQQLAL